ncbi:hypothetical protein AYI70_g3192 [Smittium culicis]|uniref:Uncharacterized protein n=1 Tax=Smittium culicis TaxID=133412 RepID=A0A1R1Y4W7_9FUNG|nr:hypothetical protein AYI70_g3192 [Smittium culicis]
MSTLEKYLVELAHKYAKARKDVDIEAMLAISSTILSQRITFLLDSETLAIISQNKISEKNKAIDQTSNSVAGISKMEFIDYEGYSDNSQFENAIIKFDTACQWKTDECNHYFRNIYSQTNHSAPINTSKEKIFYRVDDERLLEALVVIDQIECTKTQKTNTFAVILVKEDSEWKALNSVCYNDFDPSHNNTWFDSAEKALDYISAKDTIQMGVDGISDYELGSDDDGYWDEYIANDSEENDNLSDSIDSNTEIVPNVSNEKYSDISSSTRSIQQVTFDSSEGVIIPNKDNSPISSGTTATISSTKSISTSKPPNPSIKSPLDSKDDTSVNSIDHSYSNTLASTHNSSNSSSKDTKSILPENIPSPKGNLISTFNTGGNAQEKVDIQSIVHLSTMFKSISFFAKKNGISKELLLELARDSF